VCCLTFQLSLCVLRSMNTLLGSPGPYHLGQGGSSMEGRGQVRGQKVIWGAVCVEGLGGWQAAMGGA
jgi:hypothetical protein